MKIRSVVGVPGLRRLLHACRGQGRGPALSQAHGSLWLRWVFLCSWQG